MQEQQQIEIGRRIHALREASPQTNRSIADYVGVVERSVANWISGTHAPEWEHAKKVSDLFNVDVQWLWTGDERFAPGPAPDLFAVDDDAENDQLAAINRWLGALTEAVVPLLAKAEADQLRQLADSAQHRPEAPPASQTQ